MITLFQIKLIIKKLTFFQHLILICIFRNQINHFPLILQHNKIFLSINLKKNYLLFQCLNQKIIHSLLLYFNISCIMLMF